MASEPLTDREWWLVRETHRTTLKVLIECCNQTGESGKVIAQALLRSTADESLREATECMRVAFNTEKVLDA